MLFSSKLTKFFYFSLNNLSIYFLQFDTTMYEYSLYFLMYLFFLLLYKKFLVLFPQKVRHHKLIYIRSYIRFYNIIYIIHFLPPLLFKTIIFLECYKIVIYLFKYFFFMIFSHYKLLFF